MYRSMAGLVLVLTICGVPVDAQEGPPPPQQPGAVSLDQTPIDQLLATARQLLGARKLAEAQATLDAVLRRDQASIQARLMSAELAIARSDWHTARDHYKAVIDVEGHNFQANAGMGQFYIHSRYWRPATRFLEVAERFAPADRKAQAQTLLAIAFRGEGSMAKAAEYAERAVQSDPLSQEARQTLIEVRSMNREFDKALAEAAALVKLATDNARATPADPAVLRGLLDAYALQGRVFDAYGGTLFQRDARGERIDQVTPGREQQAASLMRQAVELLLAQEKVQRTLTYHDILSIARRAVQFAPDDPEGLLMMGRLLRQTEQIDLAIEAFRRVLEKDPGNAAAKRYLQELNAPPSDSSPQPAPATP
ncbi:MAG: tetratricopeptide repeat protein [Planctomycetes bacterium]|nr:tetratricopeptide repeat protein [Planctomycetota bacterium]